MLPDIPEAIGLPPGFMGLLLLAMGFPNTCSTLGIEGKTHVNVSLIITAIKYKDLEQAHFYSQAKRGSHLALGSVGHTPHGGHHRH